MVDRDVVPQSRTSLSAAATGNDIVSLAGTMARTATWWTFFTCRLPTISSSSAYTLWAATTVSGQMVIFGPGQPEVGKLQPERRLMSGNAPIDLGSGTLTTGSDNTNTTYVGRISDVGTL